MPQSWFGPVIRPLGVAHRTRYSTAPWTDFAVFAAGRRVAVSQERRARQAGHRHGVGLAAAGDPRTVVGLLTRRDSRGPSERPEGSRASRAWAAPRSRPPDRGRVLRTRPAPPSAVRNDAPAAHRLRKRTARTEPRSDWLIARIDPGLALGLGLNGEPHLEFDPARGSPGTCVVSSRFRGTSSAGVGVAPRSGRPG